MSLHPQIQQEPLFGHIDLFDQCWEMFLSHMTFIHPKNVSDWFLWSQMSPQMAQKQQIDHKDANENRFHLDSVLDSFLCQTVT